MASEDGEGFVAGKVKILGFTIEDLLNMKQYLASTSQTPRELVNSLLQGGKDEECTKERN